MSEITDAKAAPIMPYGGMRRKFRITLMQTTYTKTWATVFSSPATLSIIAPVPTPIKTSTKRPIDSIAKAECAFTKLSPKTVRTISPQKIRISANGKIKKNDIRTARVSIRCNRAFSLLV